MTSTTYITETVHIPWMENFASTDLLMVCTGIARLDEPPRAEDGARYLLTLDVEDVPELLETCELLEGLKVYRVGTSDTLKPA